MPELTPVLRQYHEIKNRHKDAVLLFRLGDFYEMFYEDAVEISRELELVLTARNRGTPNEAPMCGFPAKAARDYIARLVKNGRRVAICEQLSDPETSKGPVDRDVVRVVTAGTFTDDETLDAKENAYIASLYATARGFGAAVADLSTGEMRALEAPDMAELLDAIAQFSPREVLYPEDSPCRLTLQGDDEPAYTPVPPKFFEVKEATAQIAEQFGEDAKRVMKSLDGKPLAVGASGALLRYLRETQMRALPHILDIRPIERRFMAMDEATARNLEIFRNLQDGGRKGTLLSVLDATATAMGGRMLRQWLARPLAQKKDIEARHDAVGEWVRKSSQREAFRERLFHVLDLERLTGKIAMASANARDMVALRASLAEIPPLKKMLAEGEAALLKEHRDSLDPLDDLRTLLDKSIADSPPLAVKEGGLIREGFDAELDEKRALKRQDTQFLSDMQERERRASGIENLKVGYNRIHGYFIEISKARAANAPKHYERRQTLVNAERFITPELKGYEEKILGAEEWTMEREYQLFCGVREEVSRNAARLQKTARAVAALDVFAALADVAHHYGYCRPRVTEGARLFLKAARHPVVERLAARDAFVPNDLELDNASRQILLITGPNMGGKSTYLRQAALAVLMAQCGSFVAAEEAECAVADRIFTRVGASDNLARGQSTFMVEMSETANILKYATSRSLVILDEVGRGTSTFDGVSLAWAIVEHLHENPAIAAKTLFATHYLELTALAGVLPRVKNAHFTVKEWEGRVIFLRRVEDGAADRSYGIHVAELAGVPAPVIVRAREILKNLEEGSTMLDGMPALLRGEHKPKDAVVKQPKLFQEAEDGLAETLRKTNLDDMTPLEAMNLVAELKGKVKR